jgi:hypothetical protein
MEARTMGTVDPARRPASHDFIRMLIEEAWRRTRRRRAVCGGVLFSVVVAAGVFAAMQGHSGSVGGAPALSAGPSTPAGNGSAAAASEHIQTGLVELRGKRGRLTIALRIGTRSGLSWNALAGFGGYREVHGQGRGRELYKDWRVRLEGFLYWPTRSLGWRKQRVVITVKGRRSGTFTLTPKQPGALKPDRGTQRSHHWIG